MTILWLTRGVPFAGFGSLVALIMLFFSTLTLMVGILAEYVALIYQEVRGRPNYIIDEIV